MARSDSWLYGFLDLCLLSLLREEGYGYDITRRLAAAGLGEVPGGTVYPALMRLERQGLLTGRWGRESEGPRRRYYVLTEAGRAAVVSGAARWADFRASLDAIINAAARPERP